MTAFVAAVVGLAFGSFTTVLVHRVPERRSVVVPRSACPSCGALIRPLDNVPLASYLLLRGHCRSCGTPIGLQYPLLEASSALLFVAAVIVFKTPVVALVVGPFLALMLGIALIDWRHRIIPNRIIYPALAVYVVGIAAVEVMAGHLSIVRALLALLAYGGTLFAIAVASRGGMGMGDVKLGAFIGLVLGALGWRYVGVAALVAALAGGIGAVALLAAGRGRKQAVPFGPYLAGGAVVSALAAPQFSALYLRLAR